MSWRFCVVWDLSEPVTSLNMWRRNGRVSVVGGTHLLCATFLGAPHLHFYVLNHIKVQTTASTETQG